MGLWTSKRNVAKSLAPPACYATNSWCSEQVLFTLYDCRTPMVKSERGREVLVRGIPKMAQITLTSIPRVKTPASRASGSFPVIASSGDTKKEVPTISSGSVDGKVTTSLTV